MVIYKLVWIDTLLVLILVDATEDRVFPPSTSSSENALDIPESVDTESTAAAPENAFGFLVSAMGRWTLGVGTEQLQSKYQFQL